MRRTIGHISGSALTLGILLGAAPLAAQTQDAVSRAVVQPLPPAAVDDLSVALQRLARNSRDLGALLDAGNASLKLQDVDAAIGFFGRAGEIAPNDPRVKVGLAAAFVHSERPVDALRLFDEAEREGARTTAIAAERGLAYDLVGDNADAQAQYQAALAGGHDDEIERRMALSQAIAGDRTGFEKTLYPQLVKQDFAAFRARAFGLAILGDEDGAVAIADAVMPSDLAARIAPYLRYMGRLTKAQQAAAANLGQFPRAAQIGRDDPQIVQYASERAAARGAADARLAPAGEPLGTKVADKGSSRRRPDKGSGSVETSTRKSKRIARAERTSTQPPRSSPTPAPAPAKSELPPVGASGGLAPKAAPRAAAVPDPAPSGSEPIRQTPVPASEPASQPPTRVALNDAAVPAPGFDLGKVGSSAPASSAPPPPAVDPEPQPVSVADAFASFAVDPAIREKPATGAVDITAIKPKREVAEKPPEKKPVDKKPAPPPEPRRFWVQVATGRDLRALGFDWRRISRKAPKILGDFKPMTTPWGQANRLLAGPYKTEAAADEAVRKLKDAGVDSFQFTSDEGQAIKPLG